MKKAMMALGALFLLTACGTTGGGNHLAMNWDYINYETVGATTAQ